MKKEDQQTQSQILAYLTELEINNTREWYHDHKEEYQKANSEFENLLAQLILRLGEKDPSIAYLAPKDITFRIFRDTRFSIDKSPYNPTFRAHIAAKGKCFIPVGYYISIAPNNRSFLGVGLYMNQLKDATAMVRKYIVKHEEEWEDIITSPQFENTFTVKGTKLKNIPRGYDSDHSQAQYLKHKSWYIDYPLTDEIINTPSLFLEEVTNRFLQMQPFKNFLNQALEHFQMPEK